MNLRYLISEAERMQLTGYMQGQRKRRLLDDNEVFGLGIWKAGGSSYHSWEHGKEAD